MIHRAIAAAAAAVVLVTGCGIRSTSVPVDAGAAPSRSRCTEPRDSPSPTPTRTLSPSPDRRYELHHAVLYLVCNLQLTERERTTTVTGDYLHAADALLARLRAAPQRAERADGFTTGVPGTLRISAGRRSDPAGTLRLNQPLDGLHDFVLGQLVCTFSYNLMGGGDVLIGGPGDSPVRRFNCSVALRTKAGAEPDAGVPA